MALTKLLKSGKISIQPNREHISLRVIHSRNRRGNTRLVFISVGMYFDKSINATKSLRGYCQGITIQFSTQGFLYITAEGSDCEI